VFRLGVFKKHWGGVKGGRSPAKRTLGAATLDTRAGGLLPGGAIVRWVFNFILETGSKPRRELHLFFVAIAQTVH